MINTSNKVEEAVVQKMLGKVFVESVFLVNIVKKGNVNASRRLHTVANCTKYPHIDLLLG